jgi:hypothetical protein
MNYTLIEILSYFIGISVFISLIRWKHIQQRDYFFIAFLWAGLLSEVIATVSIDLFGTNAVVSNLYTLISAVLLILQFNRWGLFKTIRQLYVWLIGLASLVWLWENFIYSSIFAFGSYSGIVTSFLIVLMSIHMINGWISQVQTSVINNPVFLICISLILLNTTDILVEIFWIYGLNASKDFRQSIYRIITYVNLLVNILYAIAVLWMPRKKEFIWQ